MPLFWRKWTNALRRRTAPGWLVFLLAAALVGAAAVVSANNLLFLILAAMLATLMIADFVSRMSLAGLDLDFVLPEHVPARRQLAGRVYVRNTKRWTPSFSVHLSGPTGSVLTSLYFPVIPARKVLDETVDVWFERRGLYRESGFQFSTSFPFGFLERRADVKLRREVLVYPSIEARSGFEELLESIRGDLEAHYRGRGHDFHRIRPYEAFESARHVDWKATAHTGELQVREFAAEEERLLEIALDLNVPLGEEAWFERAVDACAFLVWRVAERGARVRFRTQSFDASIPEAADVYAVLRYLALVAPRRGELPAGGDERDSCRVVFTANPEGLPEQGWRGARAVTPADFRGLVIR